MFIEKNKQTDVFFERLGAFISIVTTGLQLCAFAIALVMVAVIALCFGWYFHSIIACSIAGAAVMGITGLIADYRSDGNIQSLPYGTACSIGCIVGFLLAIIAINMFHFR